MFDHKVFRQGRWDEPLIFEKKDSGKRDMSDFPKSEPCGLPAEISRKSRPNLPELSELSVVRHFTRLSQMNFGVDCGFYPLGSCTMKYNPKLNEMLANLDEAKNAHPLQSEGNVQGCLEVMHRLQNALAEISGMDAVSLQPSAGAHGEFTGVLMIRAFHERHGQSERDEMLIPDSGHGTNPASAAMAGFKVVTIPSDERGCVDLEALKSAVSPKTAGLMLTNPNTFGVFEHDIEEIAKIVHDAGGLLYYDGANLNAIMGKCRPGDMGFDVLHFNLHKTFATPHGGGGAGSGPVGARGELAKFLPVPLVGFSGGKYFLDYDVAHTIGKVKSFHGNFSVLLKAYAYIQRMGGDGLQRVSEMAVLNSNYLMRKLEKVKGLELVHHPEKPRKHEFVLGTSKLESDTGIGASDLGRKLLDYGIHAPTISFPIHGCLMIEPTETESKEEMDDFAEVLKELCEAAYAGKFDKSNTNTAMDEVDTVQAARQPVLSWKMMNMQVKPA